jgi:hypothetical protein
MPYIGKNPTSGGFHKLDSLTASATATYALTLNSAAYFPESANQLLVSLNGVIQAPQDSFTVSGSNIVFDTALTASDSIDFIVALGDVHSVGTPTDGSITATKIGSDAVTTAKIADGAVTNAKIDTMAASKLTGALPAIDGSSLTGISSGVKQTVYHTTTATTYFERNTTAEQPQLLNATNANDSTTHLSVNITPSSTSSKVLISSQFLWTLNGADNFNAYFTIFRDSTDLRPATVGNRRSVIGLPQTGSGQVSATSHLLQNDIIYIDDPQTTSEVTYTIAYGSPSTGTVARLYLNRTSSDTDSSANERGISMIMAQEI